MLNNAGPTIDAQKKQKKKRSHDGAGLLLAIAALRAAKGGTMDIPRVIRMCRRRPRM
jgi:hypothetical protein